MINYPDWVYRQSAVLPYRLRNGDPEVLLITSRSGKRWVLPKGIVEPGMTPPVSAAKEAREEAGIEGAVSTRSLGRYRQDKWGGTCRIEVFPMRVTAELETWPEAGIRRREWLPLSAAIERLEGKKLRRLLGRLPEWLAKAKTNAAEVTRIETLRLLYLLRHARSSRADRTLADFDRPLTKRGLADCEVLRDYLRLADVEPDLVLCSPATRTRQTLTAIATAFYEPAKPDFDEQIYDGGPKKLLARLSRLPESVSSAMLIGHNPGLQSLALRLAGKGDAEALARMAAAFPAGALAILVVQPPRWRNLGSGTCRLHSFVTPRDLA
ncbi:MAG: NUDIX domain-containing protein [Kiloniellales bacterium]|nr:NUDIX domain-containing protein [Kiloniellales bacterium]